MPTRILVAEDEKDVAAILTQSLKQEGYEVTAVVSSGEDVVAEVGRDTPDLVLMDIRLDGKIDGIEATRRLCSYYDVPVVYVSALSDSRTLERTKTTEAYGYLIKPVSPKDLRFGIETALCRYRIQKQLKLSEEKFRGIVEDQTDLLYRFSLEGSVSFANEAFCLYYGTQGDSVLGRHISSFLPSEDLQRIRDYFASTTEQGASLRFEHPHPSPVGESRWIHSTVRTQRNEEGETVEFQVSSRDVTERRRQHEALMRAQSDLERLVEERTAELKTSNRYLTEAIEERIWKEEELKKSEERFRMLVESASDCIFIKDRFLRYTHVNPAMKEVLGLPVSKIVGSGDKDLFDPETAARLQEVDRRVLDGETVEKEQTRTVRGQVITFLDIRSPMRTGSGQITGVFGIARDITTRAQLSDSSSKMSQREYPSSAMKKTLHLAGLAAGKTSTVLITGESGSGKDFVAQYIHQNSDRADGPFVSINCASLPQDLAETELFGHAAGAFTSGWRAKKGLVQTGESGTVLLNEIGDLPILLQAKLLTFLDTKSFIKVGGETPLKVDVRLIAATNRDLEEEMSKGRFREDLHYRLNVFSIRMPPLRDRVEDIPVLVSETLRDLAQEFQLSKVPQIDDRILEWMSGHQWPGNVRELRNVLERAVILSDGKRMLDLDHMALSQSSDDAGAVTLKLSPQQSLSDALKEAKRSIVEHALQRTGGKKQKAAYLLGISRYTLARHLKDLGMTQK